MCLDCIFQGYSVDCSKSVFLARDLEKESCCAISDPAVFSVLSCVVIVLCFACVSVGNWVVCCPSLQPAVHVQGQEPLTASMLAAAPPQEQKQMLGQHQYIPSHVSTPNPAPPALTPALMN